jgi:hypothetical protein
MNSIAAFSYIKMRESFQESEMCIGTTQETVI